MAVAVFLRFQALRLEFVLVFYPASNAEFFLTRRWSDFRAELIARGEGDPGVAAAAKGQVEMMAEGRRSPRGAARELLFALERGGILPRRP